MEAHVGVQSEEVTIEPIDSQSEFLEYLAQREQEKYEQELKEQQEEQTRQEQTQAILEKDQEIQGNVEACRAQLEEMLGTKNIEVISPATLSRFVKENDQIFYEMEDGSLVPYQSGTKEGFKAEAMKPEEDFRGKEYGGSVKVLARTYEDERGRTIYEFIEETYRPIKEEQDFLHDEPLLGIESSTEDLQSPEQGAEQIDVTKKQETTFSFFNNAEQSSLAHQQDVKHQSMLFAPEVVLDAMVVMDGLVQEKIQSQQEVMIAENSVQEEMQEISSTVESVAQEERINPIVEIENDTSSSPSPEAGPTLQTSQEYGKSADFPVIQEKMIYPEQRNETSFVPTNESPSSPTPESNSPITEKTSELFSVKNSEVSIVYERPSEAVSPEAPLLSQTIEQTMKQVVRVEVAPSIDVSPSPEITIGQQEQILHDIVSSEMNTTIKEAMSVLQTAEVGTQVIFSDVTTKSEAMILTRQELGSVSVTLYEAPPAQVPESQDLYSADVVIIEDGTEEKTMTAIEVKLSPAQETQEQQDEQIQNSSEQTEVREETEEQSITIGEAEKEKTAALKSQEVVNNSEEVSPLEVTPLLHTTEDQTEFIQSFSTPLSIIEEEENLQPTNYPATQAAARRLAV